MATVDIQSLPHFLDVSSLTLGPPFGHFLEADDVEGVDEQV